MSTSPLIFHSRPRAEADWTCPRSRYYAYDYQGGIQKDNLTIDLFIGTTIHDGIAAIGTQWKDSGSANIDKIAETSGDVVFTTLSEYLAEDPGGELFSREQSALVNGLLRVFYKNMWPNLISQYPTIIAIEQEMLYKHHGNMVFMCKPDLVLESPEGELVYCEWKSSSSKKEEWINQWNTSIQVHATMKAIEETLKKPVLGTIVQGLYKGYYSYGKFSSPIAYGYYYQKAANPPFTKGSVMYSSEYKAGYKRTPVWEMEGGMKTWVERMSQETTSEQLPQTPLIFPRWDLSDAFFRQRTTRESNILNTTHFDGSDLSVEELDTLYPQSFKACSPGYGHKCNFYTICHGGPAILEDPLSNGYILKNHEHEAPYHELAKELGL